MSFRLRRSRRALGEIDAIWLYLARHDPSAAATFLQRIESALALIGDHPRIGRTRDELGGIHGYSVAPYIILYRVDGEKGVIDLERVLDGRRDLAALIGL